MAITNRQRIDNGLTELSSGLAPFVERELITHLGESWESRVNDGMKRPLEKEANGKVHWDSYAILKVMWDQWNTTFRTPLGKTERSFVSELIDVRNDHAHEKKYSYDDTERALDTMRRLLSASGASEHADRVSDIRKECIRVQQSEEARNETRRARAVSGNPEAGLKPWREVITPHDDVAKGRYMEAEFAADLNLVHKGGPNVPSEYGDPKEFFARTYLTDGLKDLLSIGARRLNGESADPVVELQTNFGGGKTHSMLALYHLVSGVNYSDLPGVAEFFTDQGFSGVPKCRRAVLVGNNFSAAEVDKKSDGVEVRTLWGEMAWQLGGAETYELLKESDLAGTSPGKELLVKVMEKNAPCLVLIDEWVALLRQLPDEGSLAAGTFGANITFAQSLTEAAKAVKGAFVIASLPVSSIEVGGTRGQQALNELSNVVKRVAKPWTPANSSEGFEIVRRRLFKNDMDYPARDAVSKAFNKMYKDQASEFPSECREAEYVRNMESCYPIHPELFRQFEQGWATLDKFQRTRGILRLMASVIYELWDRDDRSLMIMPSSITLDTPRVVSLIKECLPDGPQWSAVIGRDIDGTDSLPVKTDNDNPNLGRYSAARRVARTVFMGSAPTVGGNNPGLGDEGMRLGCAQPGESVSTFGDALRRLTDNSVHLYADQRRYWYSLQPSVTRLAKDRAEQQDDADVNAEIIKRLRNDSERGDFNGMHIAPETSADIPDELTTKLIILGPEYLQANNDFESDAIKQAREILNSRGNSPRNFRNSLLFLSADKTRIKDLYQAVRSYLAWKSIHDEMDAEGMDLSNHAKMQVRNKTEESNNACTSRIKETWTRLLSPSQPDPTKPDITWEIISVTGNESLATRVSKKAVSNELIFKIIGAPRLKIDLDRYLWVNKDHVSLKELSEFCASYLYLPRFLNQEVLRTSIENQIQGTVPEYFAYASDFDQEKKRYLGLTLAGFRGQVMFDGSGMLVKMEVAEAQIEKEKKEAEASKGDDSQEAGKDGTEAESPVPASPDNDETPTAPSMPKRYYGSIELPAASAGMKFTDLMQEVVQHFSSDPDNQVSIRVEIVAKSPTGFDERTQRTVRENSNTLGFNSGEFEKE